MSETNDRCRILESLKDRLRQSSITADTLELDSSFRAYMAAVEVLQAEAELGTKIAKLTSEGYLIDFMPNPNTKVSFRTIRCFVSKIAGNHKVTAYGDTPIQALNAAIAEMEKNDG